MNDDWDISSSAPSTSRGRNGRPALMTIVAITLCSSASTSNGSVDDVCEPIFFFIYLIKTHI